VVANHTGSHSYSSLGEKMLGKRWKIPLDFGLWFVSLTNCVAYIYFIGEQADYVACKNWGICDNARLYMIFLLVPTLPISWV
jgi:amino acid permease